MLNRQSIVAMSQLIDISDSIIFNYPITGVKTASGSVHAFLDVKKLGSEEFEEFGIMKFKQLVDLTNIAGADGEVKLDNGIINISSDKIKCRYFTSDVSMLEDTFRTSFKMIDKTSDAQSALEFTLSSSELSQIKKVASLLNVEDLIICCDSTDAYIKTENSNQRSSNGFSIKVENANIGIENTNVILSMANFKKLPDGNYKVKVCVAGQAYITRFDSTTVDGLIINIATKAC